MPARKRSFTGKAKADAPAQSPAAASTAGDAGPRVHSPEKSARLQAARLCPGGNSLDTLGAHDGGCGRCPSGDACTVARFS